MAQPASPSPTVDPSDRPQPALEDRPSRESPRPVPAASPGPGRAPGAAPGSPTPGGSGPRGPRRLRWGWIATAVVLAGLLAYAIIPKGGAGQGQTGAAGRGRGGAAGRGGAPVSVNVARAVRSDVPIYLDAIGTVTPMATVTVRPQIAGQLQRIGFAEGQMVRAGQFLAQIDPRPSQQQLNQAQGVLARDQAGLQNARQLLQRYQTLLTQDSIARQDVDNQASAVRQLEGTLATDQAAVGQARLNLDYTRITAPVGGRVGLRQVDVGNYVTVGQATGLVVITEIAPIDVLFTLPEDDLPKVTARIRQGASLPATAFDRAQSAQLAQGRLLTLDNLVDPATGTVKAKARFTNADGGLFPNQFVNVKVLVDTLTGAVTVPSSAVLRGADGLFVYVVKPDRTVSVRAVKPGPASGQVTAIASGLQPGETVVTDGSDRLREGARVQLPGDCPPAGGRRRGGAAQGAGTQGAGTPGAGSPAQGAQAKGAAACRPASAAGNATAGAAAPEAGPATGAAASGGAGGQGVGPARLLSQLNLDAGQQAKADAILQEARATAATTDDPDARRQAMRGAMARIAPILRPDQQAKLAALRAQNGGGAAGTPAQP